MELQMPAAPKGLSEEKATRIMIGLRNETRIMIGLRNERTLRKFWITPARLGIL
jgi:hypothetical protein